MVATIVHALVLAAAGVSDPTPAEYEKHAAGLREKLPRGFTVVVEPPFVVAGDEPAETVRRRAEKTVRWAASLLRKQFFEKGPSGILDVYLFKDEASYEANAAALFGEKPGTPFGYYSRADRALVMNIATGGGTLVHEIVHPHVEADFPGCPDWLNEGLGSLFEQSAERDGKIVGLTNWRLAGLQEAIREGAAVPFEKLLATTSVEFYGDERGVHYAQARYLCYWLQEKGLLERFYKAFRAGRAEDPTGIATLKRVIGKDDLAAFRKEWEAFVLALEFRQK